MLKPIFMLRLPQLFVFSLRYGLAATARARARLWQKQVITFGWLVPDHSLVILLGERLVY